jgi:hypothetical protein
LIQKEKDCRPSRQPQLVTKGRLCF